MIIIKINQIELIKENIFFFSNLFHFFFIRCSRLYSCQEFFFLVLNEKYLRNELCIFLTFICFLLLFYFYFYDVFFISDKNGHEHLFWLISRNGEQFGGIFRFYGGIHSVQCEW